MASNGSISLGAIVSNSFGVIARNPLVVLGSTFLFSAVPQIVWGAMMQSMILANAGAENRLALAAPQFLGGVVLECLALVGAVIVICTTADDAAGHRPSIGSSLAIGLRYAVPLLGLYMLLGLGIALGMILLIVPGVIVALMWSVAGPALVIERCGIGAFGRSRALTKGFRWQILGLFVLVIAIIWAVMAVVGLLLVGSGSIMAIAAMRSTGHLPMAYTVANALIGTLTAAFFGALITSLYLALREAAEGPGNAELADIFA